MSATQVYLYAASDLLYQGRRWIPTVSGVVGDVLAGIGVEFASACVRANAGSYALFDSTLYGHEKGWGHEQLDDCLTFDWRRAKSTLNAEGIAIWSGTEGDDYLTRATLVRLRNHEIPAITNPWAAIDLWGSLVAPYYDRDFIEFMLSLPHETLRNRSGQVELFARYHPDLWPHAGLDLSTLNCTNTLNKETIARGGLRSIWPLAGDGSKPRSALFRPEGIAALEEKALAGDEASWFRLNSLQPIAWAVEKGYVYEDD